MTGALIVQNLSSPLLLETKLLRGNYFYAICIEEREEEDVCEMLKERKKGRKEEGANWGHSLFVLNMSVICDQKRK